MVNDRWEGTSRAPTAGQAPPRGGQPSRGTQRPSLDRKERRSLPRDSALGAGSQADSVGVGLSFSQQGMVSSSSGK